jgi:hypothetical protein
MVSAEGALSEIWPAAIMLFAFAGITSPGEMLAMVGLVILGAVALPAANGWGFSLRA